MAWIVAALVDTITSIKLTRMLSNNSVASKVFFGCVVGLCSYCVLLQSRYLQQGGFLKTQQQRQPPIKGTRRHDDSSKFSIMKYRGLLYNEATIQYSTIPSNHHDYDLVLDTLSIGTKYNLGLLQAQSITWASHKTIRHYFAATELDDVDPTCHAMLNKTTITKIIKTCKQASPEEAKDGMHLQYQKFSKDTKRQPGWICAQQRFAIALETLGRFYKRELSSVAANFRLPDFLLLQDDDSYYNMVRMEEFLRDLNPEIPLAEAPCLIRHTKLQNFSFPWGGYGFILSRAAVWNLIRPVYCNVTTGNSDEFESHVCLQLKADLLGERQYFQDGMSVSDLMGAQVRHNLFTDFDRNNANWAYCLHGDWVVGYYVNYYSISSHVKDPAFDGVPQVRIEGTLGSVKSQDRGNCVYGKVETCTEEAHVCHRQTAKSMANRTKEVAAKAPGAFRNYS